MKVYYKLSWLATTCRTYDKVGVHMELCLPDYTIYSVILASTAYFRRNRAV